MTERFQSESFEVRDVEKELRELDHPEGEKWADQLSKLQGLEKRKLEIVSFPVLVLLGICLFSNPLDLLTLTLTNAHTHTHSEPNRLLPCRC